MTREIRKEKEDNTRPNWLGLTCRPFSGGLKVKDFFLYHSATMQLLCTAVYCYASAMTHASFSHYPYIELYN